MFEGCTKLASLYGDAQIVNQTRAFVGISEQGLKGFLSVEGSNNMLQSPPKSPSLSTNNNTKNNVGNVNNPSVNNASKSDDFLADDDKKEEPNSVVK